jgi:ABC-type transport system involved in multi-copper enzyme maturation permease subunit
VILRAGWSVFVLSFRRLLRSKLLWSALFPTLLPLAIVSILTANLAHGEKFNEALSFLNGPFIRMVYLHFLVFFSAWGFGFATVRQEMDDQTLHYLFLQPIPRWTLIVAKAAASIAIISASIVLGLWVSYFIVALAHLGPRATAANLFGPSRQFVILVKESGVIVMGLMAYGAIGMLVGSIWKSALPAAFLLGWEWGLPYLPSTLKFWTVMHYLQSLLPVAPPQGKVFELLGDPAPTWLCFVFVGSVAFLSLALCGFLFQMRECLYKES